ncbi:MAG: hypothetical protein ABFD90_07925 [Phycisphaerales bacterium]
MDAMQLEPMSVGGILDGAFTLYRRNFLRFITIVAIIQVPLSLITLLWATMMLRGVPNTLEDGDDMRLLLLSTVGRIVILFTAIVGNALCQGTLTRSVSEAYLGHETTVGQTYRSVLPKLVTLIGASLLVGLVTGLGFMLLVVPGVIFALWFFVTTPSIVVENHRATAGMSRSKALISGNLGKAFAVGFLATAIAFIIMVPISTAAGLASKMLFANTPLLALFFRQFAALIGEVLAAPIPAAAAILLYYDLRIRKEGFDLQMLSQSMVSNQG